MSCDYSVTCLFIVQKKRKEKKKRKQNPYKVKKIKEKENKNCSCPKHPITFSLYTMPLLVILVAYFRTGLGKLSEWKLPEGNKICHC